MALWPNPRRTTTEGRFGPKGHSARTCSDHALTAPLRLLPSAPSERSIGPRRRSWVPPRTEHRTVYRSPPAPREGTVSKTSAPTGFRCSPSLLVPAQLSAEDSRSGIRRERPQRAHVGKCARAIHQYRFSGKDRLKPVRATAWSRHRSGGNTGPRPRGLPEHTRARQAACASLFKNTVLH